MTSLNPSFHPRNHVKIFSRVLLLATCLLFASCSPAIAPFSHAAYELAVDLKVDSLRLMDSAELPYSESKKKVGNLQVRMQKAFEFALGRPKNSYSTEQWRIMNDSERHLLGGFLRRWEEESSLSRSFIVEAKTIVAHSFDAIIGLESGKIGGADVR